MKNAFKWVRLGLSIFFVAVMVAVTIVISMNGYNGPEKTAKKYMDYCVKGDFQKAYKLTTATDSMTVEEFAQEMSIEYSLIQALGASLDTAKVTISDAVISETDETKATVYYSMYVDGFGMDTESVSLVLENGKWLVEE